LSNGTSSITIVSPGSNIQFTVGGVNVATVLTSGLSVTNDIRAGGKVAAGDANNFLQYSSSGHGYAIWQASNNASIYYDRTELKYYFNPNGVNAAMTVSAAGAVTASTFNSTAAGSPVITSGTSITLAAVSEVIVSATPLRLASFTTTARNGITAANGQMIYNSSDNTVQVYANGSWLTIAFV
jgi:hypothetical protein